MPPFGTTSPTFTYTLIKVPGIGDLTAFTLEPVLATSGKRFERHVYEYKIYKLNNFEYLQYEWHHHVHQMYGTHYLRRKAIENI